MRRRRLVVEAVLAAAALVSFLLLGSQPASAEIGCPHGAHNHFSSLLCWSLNGAPGIEGVGGYWANSNMYESAGEYNLGGHINNEMWLYTAWPLGPHWVEEGLRHGYSLGGCDCIDYEAFWAEWDASGEHDHTILPLSADGSFHNYSISNAGGTTWQVTFDTGFSVQTSFQTSNTAYQAVVGLEDSAPNGISPPEHADTFDNFVDGVIIGHNWTSWPTQASWTDDPCQTPGHPSGYCLNGVAHTSEWLDNKP